MRDNNIFLTRLEGIMADDQHHIRFSFYLPVRGGAVINLDITLN